MRYLFTYNNIIEIIRNNIIYKYNNNINNITINSNFIIIKVVLINKIKIVYLVYFI